VIVPDTGEICDDRYCTASASVRGVGTPGQLSGLGGDGLGLERGGLRWRLDPLDEALLFGTEPTERLHPPRADRLGLFDDGAGTVERLTLGTRGCPDVGLEPVVGGDDLLRSGLGCLSRCRLLGCAHLLPLQPAGHPDVVARLGRRQQATLGRGASE
jgi:hypothetical protein